MPQYKLTVGPSWGGPEQTTHRYLAPNLMQAIVQAVEHVQVVAASEMTPFRYLSWTLWQLRVGTAGWDQVVRRIPPNRARNRGKMRHG